MTLRFFRECDLFRKFPQEHCYAKAPESIIEVAIRLTSVVLIGGLVLNEMWDFMSPPRKQRFDLDMSESPGASESRKIRVLLDMTVWDHPCIDLSLDYQDVMGTRAVDVKTTVYKQRLRKNGSAVGEALKNNPKLSISGVPTNPSLIKKHSTSRSCGSCFGALLDGECCNTCSDVLYAYRLKRWSLPRIEEIPQCQADDSSETAYQPPQIIRFDDYSSDDFLPKFARIGGDVAKSGSEARVSTPFKFNFTFEPLTPLKLPLGPAKLLPSWSSYAFQPLTLNFSSVAPFKNIDFDDDYVDIHQPEGDILRECCRMVSAYGLVPYKTWGSAPKEREIWWDANNCNSAVGGEATPKCQAAASNRSGKGRSATSSESSILVPNSQPWPNCLWRNLIIHGWNEGEALMIDLTAYGATDGCWNDDCTESDKFSCKTLERCSSVCNQIQSCYWWTWGTEEGIQKCWLREGRSGREKRFGFVSGHRLCVSIELKNFSDKSHSDETARVLEKAIITKKGANVSVAVVNSSPAFPEPTHAGTVGDGTETHGVQSRRLSSVGDDDDFSSISHGFGSSLHMPIFGFDDSDRSRRKEQQGESCRIHGYFDMNKVPGNFHVGSHGTAIPSYLSTFGDTPKLRNMQHVINRLAFVEVEHNDPLNAFQPLDGFESPKAFTFQYYLTLNPATFIASRGGQAFEGYQFRAGSFVTNELIGPAVFFRLDIDPIRVTHYTERVRWSKVIVNICAIIGGCIASAAMLAQLLDNVFAPFEPPNED